MLYDYDWVILGNAPAAAFSAELAARQRARVAWVRSPTSVLEQQAQRAWRGFHYLRSRLCVGQLQDQQELSLEQARAWAELSEPWVALPSLTHFGVDVLLGRGRFQRDRKALSLWLSPEASTQTPLTQTSSTQSPSPQGRQLLGRRYLLAPTASPQVLHFPELAGLSVDTLQSWVDWPQLPESVAILGALPEAIALAQVLAKLGCRVLLALPSGHATHELLLSILQASGVTIWPDTTLGHNLHLSSASETSVPKIQLRLEDKCLEVERLIVAMAYQPNLEGFGLKATGLSATATLTVNRRLQTENSKIYAIGAALGGNDWDALAFHEAEVATQHALWSPWKSPVVQSQAQPKIIWTLPPQVQIGLPPATAEARYPGRIHTLRTEAPNNWRMQLAHSPIGFCELVVHRSGKLLGATVIAAEATEWMGAIALALQQRLSIDQLAHLPHITPSFNRLIREAAAQFRWQRLAEQPRREDLLERFFNWRRTGGI